MSNSHEVFYPKLDTKAFDHMDHMEPTDEERIARIAAYEGSFSEMEKLALETLARTGRDPLYCYELALSMMRLRTKLGKLRAEASHQKRVAQQELMKR